MSGERMPDGFRASRTIRDIPEEMSRRLIVALDVPTVDDARSIVRSLDGVVSFFKIGLWLLFASGADKFIDDLIRAKKDVFLDCKMYDIGETVRQGVARAVGRGVKFVTVHGDSEIMKAAVEGKGNSDTLKVFSITVLTSLDEQDLRDMGYLKSLPEIIEVRVKQSIRCGCDGIIASADDNPDEIRKMAGWDKLLIATPGIRESGRPTEDHKRFTGPFEAIDKGADYLIVGRPIIRPDNEDSITVAKRFISEMERGERQLLSRR
jgi:orotidine-5'-phosphate decarboxylase